MFSCYDFFTVKLKMEPGQSANKQINTNQKMVIKNTSPMSGAAFAGFEETEYFTFLWEQRCQ